MTFLTIEQGLLQPSRLSYSSVLRRVHLMISSSPCILRRYGPDPTSGSILDIFFAVIDAVSSDNMDEGLTRVLPMTRSMTVRQAKTSHGVLLNLSPKLENRTL